MTRQQISTTNPYINQIRQFLQLNQQVNVDWLVLAHNDSYLMKRLDEAFPESVLAVIALPQSQWRLDDKMMTEFMDWVIGELRMKGIILVGHSQGGIPEAPVKLLGGKVSSQVSSVGEAEALPNSPLDLLKRAQFQTTSIQNHFKEQIERLSRIPVIEQRLIRNQMQLHGLFYRGETGIFCAYDWQQGVFRPLLNEEAAA